MATASCCIRLPGTQRLQSEEEPEADGNCRSLEYQQRIYEDYDAEYLFLLLRNAIAHCLSAQ